MNLPVSVSFASMKIIKTKYKKISGNVCIYFLFILFVAASANGKMYLECWMNRFAKETGMFVHLIWWILFYQTIVHNWVYECVYEYLSGQKGEVSVFLGRESRSWTTGMYISGIMLSFMYVASLMLSTFGNMWCQWWTVFESLAVGYWRLQWEDICGTSFCLGSYEWRVLLQPPLFGSSSGGTWQLQLHSNVSMFPYGAIVLL